MSRALRIQLVTPGDAGARTGNRTTALRWARLLRSLGHRVRVAGRYQGERCDLLVALHARKSHESVARFRAASAGGRLVVALAGTDLYQDLPRSAPARRSLEMASRIVVLQPEALRRLPAPLRRKTRVIVQSAACPGPAAPRSRPFTACVVANLRAVKDPLRAARAARGVPAASSLQVVHFGAALEERWAARARAEETANPRYRWLGSRPRAEVLRQLCRSHLLVLSSRLEGGANVVSEALACAVPVLASRIEGSVGLLGRAYPGYFPVGDTASLTKLLLRAEREPAFLAKLRRRCRTLAVQVKPERERAAWRALLGELFPSREA